MTAIRLAFVVGHAASRSTCCLRWFGDGHFSSFLHSSAIQILEDKMLDIAIAAQRGLLTAVVCALSWGDEPGAQIRAAAVLDGLTAIADNCLRLATEAGALDVVCAAMLTGIPDEARRHLRRVLLTLARHPSNCFLMARTDVCCRSWSCSVDLVFIFFFFGDVLFVLQMLVAVIIAGLRSFSATSPTATTVSTSISPFSNTMHDGHSSYYRCNHFASPVASNAPLAPLPPPRTSPTSPESLSGINMPASAAPFPSASGMDSNILQDSDLAVGLLELLLRDLRNRVALGGRAPLVIAYIGALQTARAWGANSFAARLRTVGTRLVATGWSDTSSLPTAEDAPT